MIITLHSYPVYCSHTLFKFSYLKRIKITRNIYIFYFFNSKFSAHPLQFVSKA